MKCVQCKQEIKGRANIVIGIGSVCSQDCCQIAQGHRKKYHAELLAEPLDKMPEALTTQEFCRFMEKFAVHYLRTLDEQGMAALVDANPVLQIPEILAQEFNDKVLNFINKKYVSSAKFDGRDIRSFMADGVFCFRQPVPAEHIVEALRKADLIK